MRSRQPHRAHPRGIVRLWRLRRPPTERARERGGQRQRGREEREHQRWRPAAEDASVLRPGNARGRRGQQATPCGQPDLGARRPDRGEGGKGQLDGGGEGGHMGGHDPWHPARRIRQNSRSRRLGSVRRPACFSRSCSSRETKSLVRASLRPRRGERRAAERVRRRRVEDRTRRSPADHRGSTASSALRCHRRGCGARAAVARQTSTFARRPRCRPGATSAADVPGPDAEWPRCLHAPRSSARRS